MNRIEDSCSLFHNAWKLMTSRFPGSTVFEKEGRVHTFANIPLPFLNISSYAPRIADTDDFAKLLEQVQADAADCPHHWFHLVCEEHAPAGWQEVATAKSFAPVMGMTGMDTPDLLPPQRPLPELEWRQIKDVQGAADISHVNALAYGMPPEIFGCMHNMYIWQPDCVGIVGYLDGTPVTAAAALPVDGTIYIALVATHPEHRGKSYAEAVFRQVVAAARPLMGDGRLTLHATDAGRPVYARMGFESSARFTLLAPPAA